MNNVAFVFNKDIDEVKRAQIIELKSQHWQYDFASQLHWLNENLNENDIHAFIENNGIILSYLNIIQLNVTVENDCFVMYGIGNVCTNKKYLKRGMATELIKNVNRFIMDTSKSGLLLCHEALVSFYNKCGWNNITGVPSSIFVAEKEYCLNLMSYNLLTDMCGKRVCIDKNF